MKRKVKRLADEFGTGLHFIYEAGPCGYALLRRLRDVLGGRANWLRRLCDTEETRAIALKPIGGTHASISTLERRRVSWNHSGFQTRRRKRFAT